MSHDLELRGAPDHSVLIDRALAESALPDRSKLIKVFDDHGKELGPVTVDLEHCDAEGNALPEREDGRINRIALHAHATRRGSVASLTGQAACRLALALQRATGWPAVDRTNELRLDDLAHPWRIRVMPPAAYPERVEVDRGGRRLLLRLKQHRYRPGETVCEALDLQAGLRQGPVDLDDEAWAELAQARAAERGIAEGKPVVEEKGPGKSERTLRVEGEAEPLHVLTRVGNTTDSAFSTDGSLYAQGTSSGRLRIYQVASGRPAGKAKLGDCTVEAVRFIGPTLLGGRLRDGRLVLFDCARKALLATLGFLTDGGWVVVASDGRFDCDEGLTEINWTWVNDGGRRDDPFVVAQQPAGLRTPGLLGELLKSASP